LDSHDSKYKPLRPQWFSSPKTKVAIFMPAVNTKFQAMFFSTKKHEANLVSANHLGTFCYNPSLTIESTTCHYGSPGYNVNTSAVGNQEITPHNFDRVMTLLTVAMTVDSSFIDQKDYFYQPNTEHPEWQRFVVDSVIFGLFCNGSTHISRYKIKRRGRSYHIPNQFFWMPMAEIRKFAELSNNSDALRSLDIVPEERFVRQWLEQHRQHASPEAAILLRKGSELVRSTFPSRQEFDVIRPEVQICNWDAGWWQLKELWKEVAKEEFKELQKLRVELQKSIQHRIRLLGWMRPRDVEERDVPVPIESTLTQFLRVSRRKFVS
jgi:hypothetical protein